MKIRRHAEWDWPPERRYRPRRYAVLDATPTWTTRAIDAYWRVVITTVKMVIGAICAAIMAAGVWLFLVILNIL